MAEVTNLGTTPDGQQVDSTSVKILLHSFPASEPDPE